MLLPDTHKEPVTKDGDVGRLSNRTSVRDALVYNEAVAWPKIFTVPASPVNPPAWTVSIYAVPST